MAAVKRLNSEPKPRFQWRGLLLYILPLPLLPASVIALNADNTVAALARAVAFALAMFAATLIRKGIRLQAEGERRRFKRRASTVPYRLIGAGLLSVSMFTVAMWGLSQHSLLDAIIFALAVMLGCYLYYDFDPARKDPQVAAVGITTEELIELLEEAEDKIVSIERSSKDIDNTEFRDRLRRIAREARAILDTIEQDPVDARRARKFLKVYLDGAQQVTEGYARTHKGESNPVLEDNFRRVLTTIETVIADQQRKLQQNNLSDLEVNIEVLQMQIEKEGVT